MRISAQIPGKADFDQWGQILGRVEVPEALLARSKDMAAQYYEDAEAKDFSGDDVETFRLPSWLPDRLSCLWFPDPSQFGFAPCGLDDILVATLGVDAHQDNHGPVLMLVLHNNGLIFRQGKARHKPVAGHWFIFNDLTNHAVSSAKGKSVFVGWHVPLKWIGNSISIQE